MLFTHRWQILLRLSSYFIYQLEIGAGSMSHLPHAEQEVTDHITAYSSGVWMCTDMDVWIHAILMDYNILMSWFILVLTLPQIWSVATFADGFRPLSPLNMPGSFFQHFLLPRCWVIKFRLVLPCHFSKWLWPLVLGNGSQRPRSVCIRRFQVVTRSHCSGWDSG